MFLYLIKWIFVIEVNLLLAYIIHFGGSIKLSLKIIDCYVYLDLHDYALLLAAANSLIIMQTIIHQKAWALNLNIVIL